MAYVNYTPAAPMPMGPPSIGALRTGESPQRRFLNRIKDQGIKTRDGRLRVMQCVDDQGVSRNNTAVVDKCVAQYKGEEIVEGVPTWMWIAGAGVGAFVLLRVFGR